MKPAKLIAISLFVAAAAVAQENPFFKPSTLPYQAPPFDKIKDSDYQPAIEEGMKQELAEVEAIADDPAPPTFANTFEAMEKSGALLRRVQRVFGGLAQSNTNPTIQKVQQEMAPKLAAHRDAIVLNPKLFARIKAIDDQRDALKLDAEQKQLVERTYRDFVRAGALLSDPDKVTLRALNKEQSQLTTAFRKKVLADTNASAVVIDDRAMLDRREGARAGREVGAHAAEHHAAAARHVSQGPRAARAPLHRIVQARQPRRRE